MVFLVYSSSRREIAFGRLERIKKRAHNIFGDRVLEGANLSELCRKKFNSYPNFSVKTAKFEDCGFNDNSVDLVFSASAFHWIPEEIGYYKVYSMLKPSGVFARFANHLHLDKGRPKMCDAIQEVYKAYAPHRNGTYAPPVEYIEEKVGERALIAEKYGLTKIDYRMYYSTRTFTADNYICLLGTYTSTISL